MCSMSENLDKQTINSSSYEDNQGSEYESVSITELLASGQMDIFDFPFDDEDKDEDRWFEGSSGAHVGDGWYLFRGGVVDRSSERFCQEPEEPRIKVPAYSILEEPWLDGPSGGYIGDGWYLFHGKAVDRSPESTYQEPETCSICSKTDMDRFYIKNKTCMCSSCYDLNVTQTVLNMRLPKELQGEIYSIDPTYCSDCEQTGLGYYHYPGVGKNEPVCGWCEQQRNPKVYPKDLKEIKDLQRSPPLQSTYEMLLTECFICPQPPNVFLYDCIIDTLIVSYCHTCFKEHKYRWNPTLMYATLSTPPAYDIKYPPHS